jgi:hypothetical protein
MLCSPQGIFMDCCSHLYPDLLLPDIFILISLPEWMNPSIANPGSLGIKFSLFSYCVKTKAGCLQLGLELLICQ